MVQIINNLTRIIAGVTVPDTPLINASIALAQQSLPVNGFNHVMRSWLNGQALINHLPVKNRSVIDTEAFAVATILHDLGWYAPFCHFYIYVLTIYLTGHSTLAT